MGWETGVTLAASGLQAINTTNNALAESKATAASADYTAQNLANKTSRNEGTLETSFVKGGIALNGFTAVQQVFQQAAQQGSTDIQRTVDNANNNIKNTMNSARTQALTGIASSLGKIPASTITSAWNGLTGNTDPSPSGTGVINTSALDSFSTASLGGGTGGLGTGFNWGS